MTVNVLKKDISIIFLKVVLLLVALIGLAFCIFAVPAIGREIQEFLNIPNLQYLIMIGMYIGAVSFYIALYQAYKIITYIESNTTFSPLSIQALKKIQYCAILISLICAIFLPLFFFVAQQDDAPGLVVIGMLISAVPVVVFVLVTVLQKLLQNVIAIKSENDLTV